MDITVETVREAQFRQAWKGYDTAEVDDFLDSIASGIGSLQSKVGELTERVGSAEDRALRAEARPSLRSEPDESVRRTLVLAQRAADLVVSEAKAVSDRIVADARDQAATIINVSREEAARTKSSAESQAEHLLAGAEAEAARMISVRAAELQSSLSTLVDEQARRRVELEHLGNLISDTKAQWRSVLAGQLEHLGADPSVGNPSSTDPSVGNLSSAASDPGVDPVSGVDPVPGVDPAQMTNNIERQVDEVLARVSGVETSS